MTDADQALIDAVCETSTEAFDPDFLGDGGHIVAAGVRTADGRAYDGVSLPAAIGRASVCAEPVAVGSAVADGHDHDDIETCVAVSYPHPDHDATDHRVIPPCGVCRELLVDYNPEMRVVVPGDEPGVDGTDAGTDPAGQRLAAVSAESLLPVRTW